MHIADVCTAVFSVPFLEQPPHSTALQISYVGERNVAMATAVHLRESPNNNPFQFVPIHFHTLAICTRHVGVYSHMHMCVCVCVCVCQDSNVKCLLH